MRKVRAGPRASYAAATRSSGNGTDGRRQRPAGSGAVVRARGALAPPARAPGRRTP